MTIFETEMNLHIRLRMEALRACNSYSESFESSGQVIKDKRHIQLSLNGDGSKWLKNNKKKEEHNG